MGFIGAYRYRPIRKKAYRLYPDIEPPIFCKNKYDLGLHFLLLTRQLLNNYWTVAQQLLDSYSSVTGQLLVIGALCNYYKRTLWKLELT